jgi:ABC-type transport system substrate-binding protein
MKTKRIACLTSATLMLLTLLVPLVSAPPPRYYLTINVQGSGITIPAPGVHTCKKGDVVTVTAIAYSAWTFDHWVLDGVDVGSVNPYTVIMDADHSLTANFAVLIGPATDILTFNVTTGPVARLACMTATPPTADVWPSLSVPIDLWSSLLEEQNGGITTTADFEALSAAGYLMTQDLAFHTGAIVYNIRADQSYRRSGITYWPLKDVEFRHALIHSYDQFAIIATIYGYVAAPVRSLVPFAQSKYYDSVVPTHPFNPGDPFTSPPDEHSTCGILKAAGYTFVDADSTGTVTGVDYWKCPDGSPLPRIDISTPTATVAPTSNTHVSRFIADLANIGLTATTANGMHGFNQVTPAFSAYLAAVYNGANFDACLVFYGVDKLPDQLYSLLHTSQDSLLHPGRKNAPGINDATIDALCEQVKYSLDTDEVEAAAKEIQTMLYSPDLPDADNFALAYMCLYSRAHFNAYQPNLQGIVKSPGYGADNKWTFLNIEWAATPRMVGTSTQVIWMLDEAPSTFNPLAANTKYEWEILAQVYDGLANENPYNHYDMLWLASDWIITETVDGMDIDLTLRDDVYWQDGYLFTAYDVEFCLEFIRDWEIPRYAETWQTLIDVSVTDATHCTVHVSEQGIALFYDYMGLAAMLPPQIWDRTWSSQAAVLAYNPEAHAYGSDMAPGYSPGPWAAQVPMNLFGTGPWIFQFYVAPQCDLFANRNYFLTALQIDNLLADMFWEIGDYSWCSPALPDDGIVNGADLTYVSLVFGCMQYIDPCYDPCADFNSDGIVDTRDISNCAFHLLWQRTYP